MLRRPCDTLLPYIQLRNLQELSLIAIENRYIQSNIWSYVVTSISASLVNLLNSATAKKLGILQPKLRSTLLTKKKNELPAHLAARSPHQTSTEQVKEI